jgi:hypothetical protein
MVKYYSLKQILGFEYYHCPKWGNKAELVGNHIKIYGDYYSLGTGKLKNTGGEIKLRKCCNDCRVKFYENYYKKYNKDNKNDKFIKDIDDLFYKCLWDTLPSPLHIIQL